MRNFKIKKEADLEKIKARNIEPITITEIADGWDVEVEEDVDIDAIINPEPIPAPKKDKKTKKKKR